MALSRMSVIKAIRALPAEEQLLLFEKLSRMQLGPAPAETDAQRQAKVDRHAQRLKEKEARRLERAMAKEQEAQARRVRREEREATRIAAALSTREDHPESRRGREAELLRQRAIEAANRAQEAAQRLTAQVIDQETATAEGRAAKEAFERISRELEDLRGSYYLTNAEKKIDLLEMSGFVDVADLVLAERRTYLGYDRMYTIWQAVHAAPTNRPIVEVGTYRGGSAKFIAETLRRVGRAPHFFVCDTFVGSGHRDTEPTLTSPEGVATYLADYPNIEVVVGDIQDRKRDLPANACYGFVHIDVDWYAATESCLEFFAPKLAPGAMIVLDDYGFLTCPGAKQAADEYIARHPEFQLLHLLTGQALIYRRV